MEKENLSSLEGHVLARPTLDLNQLKIDRCIFHCAEALRIVGILLQPYMPTKAAQLLDMLGVDESRRTFDDAQFEVDYTYGEPKLPPGKDAFDSLFPPLSVEN
jgi:methionyl-tRNA synthetase